MKKILILLVVFVMYCGVAFADTYVKGYYRKDGTYVQPHYRSDSNGTYRDNWSYKGNVNPYTGKKGYKSYGDSYSGGKNFKYYN